MEKKTIVARVEVLPGKEQAFLQAADALIKGTRAEEGNISFHFLRRVQRPACHGYTCGIPPFPGFWKGNQGNAGIRFDN